MKTGKQQQKQGNTTVQQARKKPYSAPKLIVHGSIEKITQDKGLLLGDGLISGSLLG